MKEEKKRKIIQYSMVIVMVMSLVVIPRLILAREQNPTNQQKIESKINTNNDTIIKTDTVEKLHTLNKTNKKSLTLIEDNLFTIAKQGGPLMIFIIILGLAALTIIIERIIYFTLNSIWNGSNIDAILRTRATGSPAVYREDLEDELTSSFSVYSKDMERSMGLLSGIGNLAPIVGFLGTVIGMIKAFASIAAAATVNAKVVAVGIQIALVTTAGGLIVAAPALAFYFLFVHIIQNRYADAEKIINELTDKMPRLSNQLQMDEANSEEIFYNR